MGFNAGFKGLIRYNRFCTSSNYHFSFCYHQLHYCYLYIIIELVRGWTFPGWNPGGGEIFCTCPDQPWGPPSLLYNGYRVFPGRKEQPGHDTDPSPPSSATGHERVKLYLYSPYGPYGLYRASVPVQWWIKKKLRSLTVEDIKCVGKRSIEAGLRHRNTTVNKGLRSMVLFSVFEWRTWLCVTPLT